MLLSIVGLLGLLPSLFKAAIAIATPLLVALSDLFVALLKRCWEGFTDVVDSLSTIIFVLVLMGGTALAVKYDSYKDCKVEKQAITKKLTKKSLKKEDYSKYPDLDTSKLWKLW